MKKLNFGSGTHLIRSRYYNDWDNADIETHNNANLIFDFDKFPYPMKDNSYGYILASHVLEHLRFPEKAIGELCRVCKSNGVIDINVPHMNSEGAFNLGHINQWTKASFMLLQTPVGWENIKGYKIKIIELEIVPTRIGRMIPKFLRFTLSRCLRGIYSEIKVKLRVQK